MFIILVISISCVTHAEFEAEIVHWWSSESETKAVNYLAEEYKRRGGKWQSVVKTSFAQAREQTISRLAQGYYPTAMLWNAGFETRQLYDLRFLRAINDLDKTHEWHSYYNDMVLEIIKKQGYYQFASYYPW